MCRGRIPVALPPLGNWLVSRVQRSPCARATVSASYRKHESFGIPHPPCRARDLEPGYTPAIPTSHQRCPKSYVSTARRLPPNCGPFRFVGSWGSCGNLTKLPRSMRSQNIEDANFLPSLTFWAGRGYSELSSGKPHFVKESVLDFPNRLMAQA